jgi:TRAP-type C4-dicarboxylate transport system permease small subunit
VFQRIEFACATALLAAIVLLVGIAAVTRVAGAPIIWSLEVSTALFVWLVVLAVDLAMQNQRHFGLSVILDNVSDRSKPWVEAGNIIVVMLLLCFLFYYAAINVPLMQKRMLGALQIPKSYVHLAMPFGIVMWLRTLAVQLYAKVRSA